MDPNIGFYYLRARYFAPSTGRFLTTDPLSGDIFIRLLCTVICTQRMIRSIGGTPSGQETLIETATTLAIDGILNTLRFARPLLNVIGTAGQRALGNALPNDSR